MVGNLKSQIMEMIEGMENEWFIKMIYGFVKKLFDEEKAGN